MFVLTEEEWEFIHDVVEMTTNDLNFTCKKMKVKKSRHGVVNKYVKQKNILDEYLKKYEEMFCDYGTEWDTYERYIGNLIFWVERNL